MNAPVEHLKLDAELVPVGVIVPSSTHIQQSRRKRFNDEAMLELANSIKTSGVINPILVRPVPVAAAIGITPHPKYEIVAGERRYIATKRAGLAHIPCVIRDLDDGQVLEAQLVENLQREDLNPLEEAEGYAELKTLKGYDAEKIGELIGKSKSYVYARLKLNELIPAAREAVHAGKLDFSKALLLARIRSEKLQQKALAPLIETNWRGETVSYREAFAKLREKFMVDLNQAPFTLDDATVFDPSKTRKGSLVDSTFCACTACPHYSGNDPELQRDLGTGAHVCTDPDNYAAKAKAFWKMKAEAAKKDGRTIITGDEAKNIIPGQYDCGIKNGYLDLDATCAEAEFPEPEPEDEDSPEHAAWEQRFEQWREPTYRQVLGAEAPAAVLAAHPDKGKLVELVPLTQAAAVLKTKGAAIPSWKLKSTPTEAHSVPARETAEQRSQREAEIERENEKRRVEEEWRKRLFREVHAKWKGPLKQPELGWILETILDNVGMSDAIEELYPKHVAVEKLSEADVTRRILLEVIAAEVDDVWDKPARLTEVADRLKIDTKKIRADVVRDLKPTSAPKSTAIEETPPAADKAAPKKPAAKKKPTAKKAPAKKAATKK